MKNLRSIMIILAIAVLSINATAQDMNSKDMAKMKDSKIVHPAVCVLYTTQGNIEADDSGNAHLEYVNKTISFDGDASIIGRSVIVHQNEDDLKTQPSGNAGP